MDTQDVMARQETKETMEFQVHLVNPDQKDTQDQMEMPVIQVISSTGNAISGRELKC